MASTAARKVLVVGGSGFVGQSVCRAVTVRGWQAVSLSRRGEPDTFQRRKPAWADNVQWVAGDSLDAALVAKHLEGVTSVVHTVGVLLENEQYKSLLNKPSVSGVACMLADLAGMKDKGNPLKHAHSDPITYERMNRDTALSVAKEAAKVPSVSSFVFLSAADIFPMISPRYITTKREVESYLMSRPEFRSVILRPGFMYDDQRQPLATVFYAANTLSRPFAKDLATLPLGKLATTPPLHVDTVAEAIAEGIARDDTPPILDVEGIQRLAASCIKH